METDLNKNAEQIIEKEEKFRAIFDNAPDGILIADLESKKFYMANKAICQMLGYGLEEIKNLGVMNIHPEKDLPYVIDQFERQIKGEFSLSRDLPIKRKDGSVFYADVNAATIKIAEKTYLMGFFHDTTERKEIEEALRESESHFREAQSLGRIGSWEFDVEKQTIVWSEETYVLYERDPKLGPPSPEEEAHYYSAEQAKTLRDYATRAIETGKEFSYDLTAKFPNGRTAYFVATMRPAKDERGRVVKLFGTVQDITERRKTEEELKQKNAEMKRMNKIMTGRELKVLELKKEIEVLRQTSTKGGQAG